ncbi:hypothetical protein BH10BAC2_BH10BAC2_35850 [soil metagenome]
MRLKMTPKLILISALSLLTANTILAQDTVKVMTASDSLKWAFAKIDSLKAATTPPKTQNSLTIGFEFRTRTEYRYGYRILPTEDTTAAFFTNQRGRLVLDFKAQKFDFRASLQETRVWGQQDGAAPGIPITFFELYAEPKITDKFSVRLGRQRILYDNQRIFAENDWRAAANAHDAIRLIYNNNRNFTTELIGAYNQSAENNLSTNYKPTNFNNYKTLIVNYLNYKPSSHFTITTINTADGYQSSVPSAYTTTFMRFTSGGRLDYNSNNWYVTMSGYYQYGKDSSGKKIDAYYLQPEIKYINTAWTVRLGMEYLSGHNANQPVEKDNNFVPLYGVAHRFMGNMDFFTRFPTDVSSAGLINPYLFIWYQKGKIFLRAEHHLFYTQNDYIFKGEIIKKYMGYETDLRINYKFTSYAELEGGVSMAFVTNSMAVIRNPKISDPESVRKTPYWSYLSFKFTPTLLKFSF